MPTQNTYFLLKVWLNIKKAPLPNKKLIQQAISLGKGPTLLMCYSKFINICYTFSPFIPFRPSKVSKFFEKKDNIHNNFSLQFKITFRLELLRDKGKTKIFFFNSKYNITQKCKDEKVVQFEFETIEGKFDPLFKIS